MKKWVAIALIVALATLGCKQTKTNDPMVAEVPAAKTATAEEKPWVAPAVYVEEVNKPEPEAVHVIVWGDEVLVTARKYSYVRESKGPNRSPEIDKFHDYVGLPYGNPWCLMYVTYCWKETLEPYGLKPHTRMARVATFLNHAMKHKYHYKVMYSKGVLLGAEKIEPGDMAIWIKGVNKKPGDDFNGHIGFVIKQVRPDWVKTIEGNTGPPKGTGDQREGDGVYERDRFIVRGEDFRIEAFARAYHEERTR